MGQKILLTFETITLLIAIHWQPLMGIAASSCGALYYLSMLKINVVDIKHSGSWLSFFKSILNIKK